MGGRFCDDVVVADEYRVECKYRADGSGFKRVYDWLGGARMLHITCGDGSSWMVQTLGDWCADLILELDGWSPVYKSDELVMHETKSSLGVMSDWIGGADFLALRMPRMPWLVARQTKRELS